MVVPDFLLIVNNCRSKTPGRVYTSSSYRNGGKMRYEYCKSDWQGNQNLNKTQINSESAVISLLCAVYHSQRLKKICLAYKFILLSRSHISGFITETLLDRFFMRRFLWLVKCILDCIRTINLITQI
jgi:hypothetical protein